MGTAKSMNHAKDIISPFTPFTPYTYGELNNEIVNTLQNIRVSLDHSMYSSTENLLDYSTYLVNQKQKHLESILDKASRTPITQKDYDDLVENFYYLKNNMDSISNRLNDLAFRSLK